MLLLALGMTLGAGQAIAEAADAELTIEAPDGTYVEVYKGTARVTKGNVSSGNSVTVVLIFSGFQSHRLSFLDDVHSFLPYKFICTGRIVTLRQQYPEARVVVHPECRPDVIALADEALSTGGICRYAAREEVQQLIVGTELGILHRLKKENPGKVFIPVSEQAVCPNMKQITLEKILWSLEDLSPEVKVPENIRVKAEAAIVKMLKLSESPA